MTDTSRTATEQLLVSGAIDQTVSRLDFRSLSGKKVFFDPQYLDGSVDKGYLISSMRQHLLASGCLLMEDRTKATYVVEARAGGVGTDNHSLLVGVPQMSLPAVVPGVPTTVPEIPLVKKSRQTAVAKVAVFAYNRLTGERVWQSGVEESLSSARDLWVLGAGPFQNGPVYKGTTFGGDKLSEVPLPLGGGVEEEDAGELALTGSLAWTEQQRPPAVMPRADEPSKLPAWLTGESK
jgi:hypothetical protein